MDYILFCSGFLLVVLITIVPNPVVGFENIVFCCCCFCCCLFVFLGFFSTAAIAVLNGCIFLGI